jgi:antitoxin (DNA-binding transcriptional repressor) of toxin-antitoxin stability system
MPTLTIVEAQAKLTELIHDLTPGDEVIIMENNEPIARILPVKKPQRQPRLPGTLRGTVLNMAPDFNAPLDDFKEYME